MHPSLTRKLRVSALALLTLGCVGLQAQPAPASPAPATAAAAPASPLVSELKAQLVVPATETAPETLVAVEKVTPGQVVEYTLTYTNRSAGALRTVGIDGPVPAEVIFVADSNRQPAGQPVLYSIDGGTTFSAPPVKYKKTQPDGTVIDAVATPEMYNRLRWIVPEFPSGQTLVFAYRVRVR